MSDDDGSPPGRVSLRRGKKKDGANWVMFAGGAIAMAVSVAFGRKKISDEEEKKKENALDSTRIQISHQGDNESVAFQAFEKVPHGTSHWGKSESAAPSAQVDIKFSRSKTKRPAPNDPIPPVSKVCRQVNQSLVTSQESKDHVQSETQISSALQASVTGRRDVMHRLRQQVKSRDAIIYDMQAQLSDQDQVITMHRNHTVDLQDCVQIISTKLFEANLEVQRLQQELMVHRAKSITDLDEEFIGYAVSEIKRQWVHPDVEEISLGARKLSEEVERLQRENDAKENEVQAKTRQCESLSKRVSTLATELEEVKTAAHGKHRLLEVKEQEYLKLNTVVQDLQDKLEIEARDNEWLLMALFAVASKGQKKPGKEKQT